MSLTIYRNLKLTQLDNNITMKKTFIIFSILITQTLTFAQDSKVSKIAKYISNDKWSDARELLDELDNNPKYKNDIDYWFVRTCYYKAAIATHINSDKELYKVELFEAGKSLAKLIEFDGTDASKSYSEYIPQFRKEIYKRADVGLNIPSNENINKFQKTESSISYSDNTHQDNKAQSEKIIKPSNNISKETTKLDESGKTVTLTEIGQGKTRDDAKYNALRNALEKAFGTFISSNTTIFNDALAKDEIVSVSSGNIQNFEILSEKQMADGSYNSLVKTTVSIGKLITFCESKGISVEFKGNLFMTNYKIEELKEQNQKQVLDNLNYEIEKMFKLSNFYDYSINVSEPREKWKAYKSAWVDWEVVITVEAKLNTNINNVRNLIAQTTKGIGTGTDLNLYIELLKNNSNEFLISNGINKISFSDILECINSQSEKCGYSKDSRSKFIEFKSWGSILYDDNLRVNFNFIQALTEEEISKIKEYKVEPKNKLSNNN